MLQRTQRKRQYLLAKSLVLPVPFVVVTVIAAVASVTTARSVEAQQRTLTAISRKDAIKEARVAGARLRIARADSESALGMLRVARQFENPTLSLQHTQSTPREHFSLDVPVDLPWVRSARIGVAQAQLVAAGYRVALENESVAFDVDTLYTRALVAAARVTLSTQSARDADSLLVLSRLRMASGDASQFDVELATVVAGQLSSAAALDSMELVSLMLNLQAAIGRSSTEVSVSLTDTLESASSAGLGLSDIGSPDVGSSLLLRAAREDLRAAQASVAYERNRVFSGAGLSVGFESVDPGGTGRKPLPSLGVTVPLPVFNRNTASTAVAEAGRLRAAETLRQAEIELSSATARAIRSLALARERVFRSASLQASAQRVAALALLAYQEGAAGLPSVIEAQRTARDTRMQYLEDIAAAHIAAGLVRLLTYSGSAGI